MIMDNSNVKDPYYLITQTPPNLVKDNYYLHELQEKVDNIINTAVIID